MTNIFIGNLNCNTTPETIRSLFEPLGSVRKFRMITHPATGLSRGCAFVWMREVEAGPAIAALDGAIVDGQSIKVRQGRPQLHRAKRAGEQAP
jgi:RNA recognition motif-containing protein